MMGQLASARQPRRMGLESAGVTLASKSAGSSVQATYFLEGWTGSPNPAVFPRICGRSRTNR